MKWKESQDGRETKKVQQWHRSKDSQRGGGWGVVGCYLTTSSPNWLFWRNWTTWCVSRRDATKIDGCNQPPLCRLAILLLIVLSWTWTLMFAALWRPVTTKISHQIKIKHRARVCRTVRECWRSLQSPGRAFKHKDRTKPPPPPLIFHLILSIIMEYVNKRGRKKKTEERKERWGRGAAEKARARKRPESGTNTNHLSTKSQFPSSS